MSALLVEAASPAPTHQVTVEKCRGQQRHGQGKKSHEGPKISRLATELYTVSYLIFFAILGTLARLGLQAVTFYPGAPIIFRSIWPNFAGSLFMGFISEDRKIFKEEWGTPTCHQQIELRGQDEENNFPESGTMINLAAAKRAHLAVKKTIPLYIGLATGFCGSFTSFSAFNRDAFLALSQDLPVPLSNAGGATTLVAPRNGGYSFMAVIAVVIITVAICISALYTGAHCATFLDPYIPSLPYIVIRKAIDPVAVVLAWVSWMGAIFLSIWPPDRHSSAPDVWRGRAAFAIVFAPFGCLCRFYVSLYLNGKIASFPLGTFAVNMFGTAILGMSWDLQHVALGGIIGCQVIQGIEDGFCGCLTTVSTWVSELAALRRTHAYKYGAVSVVIGSCLLVVIMGSLRWTRGFSEVLCIY